MKKETPKVNSQPSQNHNKTKSRTIQPDNKSTKSRQKNSNSNKPKEDTTSALNGPLDIHKNQQQEEDMFSQKTDKETIQMQQNIEKQIKHYEELIRLEKEQRKQLIDDKKMDIAKKDKTINQMTQTNKKLQKQLEVLQVNVQEKLDKVEYKEKADQFEIDRQKRETPLEQLVKVKERELNYSMQVIENSRKEKEKYEAILKDKIDIVQINSLNDQIKIANEKVTELEKEVVFLSKIRDEHLKCSNIKEKLESEITDIKKSIHSLKRENKERIRVERQQISYKPNNNQEEKVKKTLEEREREMKHNIDNYWKENDQMLVSKSDFQNNNSYNQSFATTNKKKGNDNMGNTNMKNNKTNILPAIPQLFTNEEKAVLGNVLPQKEIEKYEKRFECVDITKQTLERKLILESKILNKENQDIESRYEYSSLQLKENEEKNKNLLQQIEDQRKELKEHKNKLNDLMKNLEDAKTKAKEKEIENRKLAEELQKVQKKYESNSI